MSSRYSAHFSARELQCPQTEIIQLAKGFLDELEALRREYDAPMRVTSCCRSQPYNNEILGHRTSFHMFDNPHYNTDTCAIDIIRPAGPLLHRLVAIATQRSWSIGIDRQFIHLDMRSRYAELPARIFIYG